ncbi:hypothetical protein IQ22_04073 [Pseudomonas duriflava]|uniref:Transposase n=1 Tax=Pseudomonas duriflava TaxID=459528 RepID=A0A562PXV2_9PSED|nr:hypothetical protein IQ22_04073 [Pseudomonas duriflava]
MAQVLHKRATTTHTIRAELQRSQDSIATLSKRYNLNPKTVIKWRKRDSVEDQPMGPREPHSTSLTLAGEAVAIAFRQKTLLPLDDCRMPCSVLYPGFRARACIGSTSDTASATSRAQLSRYVRRKPSNAIRWAICISISPRCIPQRAGPISLWRSIARRSLSMPSYMSR